MTIAKDPSHIADDFVAVRQARDAGLAAPALVLPSIRVNLRAGRFPPAGENGVRYIKIPVKAENPAAVEAVEARR